MKIHLSEKEFLESEIKRLEHNNEVLIAKRVEMRDTIDMAREAGVVPYVFTSVDEECLFRLKSFAVLVRADEAEKYKWNIHSCGPTCKRYACVSMREAVEAEREACAKLLENTDLSGLKNNPSAQQFIAELLCAYVNAIRARGQA